MTNRAVATRYARALLEVSRRDGDPARVEQDLAGFVDLMSEHPALGGALINPAVSPSRKRAVVSALAGQTDLSDLARRLLLMLAERDRLALLDEIVEAYRERLEALHGIVRARITTAAPLGPERAQEIARTIERATGRQVALQTDVDDTLLGGLVARIGGTVYDGSIAHHLERLRRRFLSEA